MDKSHYIFRSACGVLRRLGDNSCFTKCTTRLTMSTQPRMSPGKQGLSHCSCSTSRKHLLNTPIAFRSLHTSVYRPQERSTKASHYATTVSPPATSSSDNGPVGAPRVVGDGVDPYTLVRDDIRGLTQDIRQEVHTDVPVLQALAQYYFDGEGKMFRPMLAILMGRALNKHTGVPGDIPGSPLLYTQRRVAMVMEMIHTASLVHDDVIDEADCRRGKPSINTVWSSKKCVLTGDYILSLASVALAKLRYPDAVITMSQIIADLVMGEVMQLEAGGGDEAGRFNTYLEKTYKKTASLFANMCKGVAIMGHCSEQMQDLAFQYGKNLGLAFQLVDDILDFVSSAEMLGKPSGADLKLGLATGPVLFAAQQFPELNAMIARKFSEEGDAERALDLVRQSDGLAETKMLASKYCQQAIDSISQLTDSPEKSGLETLVHMVLERNK